MGRAGTVSRVDADAVLAVFGDVRRRRPHAPGALSGSRNVQSGFQAAGERRLQRATLRRLGAR